ncbi:MAG: UbiD family decarboxylase [Chitinophagales bacterium]|nr:UbiD family decarboxylase [Chitinophagales bacterium]
MSYSNLTECLLDLERSGQLRRVTEPVDPYLEMAAIHRRVFDAQGPALWFTNVKGSRFTAVSNLFGTIERSRYIFRDTLPKVKKMVALKADPTAVLRQPLSYAAMPFAALSALPMRGSRHASMAHETTISQLPPIQCWQNDGGAFITLPLVYSEDITSPGIMKANLGMYRIQLSGNDYVPDREIGLHYQLHRGIGVHQSKANALGKPLRVSIFVGGPPAHILAAVMPLPEGLSEMMFAGALAGRRFRYGYHDGYAISSDADFVITGDIYPNETKPEGPFGDHLGYYSLAHPFPVMRVRQVFHRRDAVWSFTVVGRPPQEDTAFGALIHEITDRAIPAEIPGLHAVHAVDAAGVHPLLLAIGSERYTPYSSERRPQELLTIANHILGTGQMSLAKYLFIIARQDDANLDIHHIAAYLSHLLRRIDWRRDLHFQTETTIDTLDYSGTDLNVGSKVIWAAAGDPIRQLSREVPTDLSLPDGFNQAHIASEGILCLQAPPYTDRHTAEAQITQLLQYIEPQQHRLNELPLIVVCDDSAFTAQNLRNFLWVTFTRSNPSHDISGIGSFTHYKHWGCTGSLLIDARIKPHHAPPLIDHPEIERHIDRLWQKGGSLHGIG